MISGNLNGLKKTYIKILEELIDYQIEADKILDNYIVDILIDITEKTNREILILINDKNKIVNISVGDSKSALYPEFDIRIKTRGLSGIRSFHTHPGGSSKLSNPDLSSLIQMKMDMVGAISKINNNSLMVNVAIPDILNNNIVAKEFGPYNLKQLNSFNYKDMLESTNKYLISQWKTKDVSDNREKAVLIGIDEKSTSAILDIETSINELEELAKTAGAIVTHKLIQKRDRIDRSFYLGKGKLEELRMIIQNTNSNLVISNDELSALQIKVLETYLGVKVVDRTIIILDIFASHARTSEGKLQVELAQLKYRLPRLLGMGNILSRTGAGIGTRGPGEKKLEIDRRLIYKQINDLEKRIKKVDIVRTQQKVNRIKNQIPVVSLVGYTNAGKSTLFNLLTNSSVISEDKLFATLDSTTRRIKYDKNQFLLSDTVGFIDKLPHDLINAFRSTLSEVIDADMILHVIDTSNPKCLKQIQIVEEVLKSIECENKNVIYVFNKIDIESKDFENTYSIIREKKIKISAKDNIGIEELNELIIKELFGSSINRKILVPYTDGNITSILHEKDIVIDENYNEDGITMIINSNEEIDRLIEKYMTEDISEKDE